MSRKKEDKKRQDENIANGEHQEMPAEDDLKAKEEGSQEQENRKEEMIELSRHRRLQADFENFKRRSRQEMENMMCYGKEQVIIDLLPVMDNFSRALSFETDNRELQQFKEGMEMIYRQLNEALKRHGLSPIEAAGETFDPECHEAIVQEEAECKEDDNKVLEDMQTGYRLDGKVIRPSMVKVGLHNENQGQNNNEENDENDENE